jgi:hypothetical protein
VVWNGAFSGDTCTDTVNGARPTAAPTARGAQSGRRNVRWERAQHAWSAIGGKDGKDARGQGFGDSAAYRPTW